MVEHTHPISSDLFHQDKDKIEQNHEELIQILMSSYVKPGQIKNTLNEREGLVVSVNHVRYKMKQLLGPYLCDREINIQDNIIKHKTQHAILIDIDTILHPSNISK